jgi:hypothetical protein
MLKEKQFLRKIFQKTLKDCSIKVITIFCMKMEGII